MSSTWRCLIPAFAHRAEGPGPLGEVGGEAHFANESSREARMAELQELCKPRRLRTEEVQQKESRGAHTRRLSVASKWTPSAWRRSSGRLSKIDHGTSTVRKTLRTTGNGKGREGSGESKTHYEQSEDGDHTVTCGCSSKPRSTGESTRMRGRTGMCVRAEVTLRGLCRRRFHRMTLASPIAAIHISRVDCLQTEEPRETSSCGALLRYE